MNPFFYLNNSPFKSFWMGGFECSDKLNAFGNRVDLINATGHLQLLSEDYARLSQFGISTVREGIRWSQVEKKPYEYDWSTVEKMVRIATACQVQQVWDICHFGFPDDLTPLHPMFARRFASLCKSFVSFYRSINLNDELIVTPINEVSFLSWLGGDVRGTSPYCVGQGWEVKYSLMKAYIEGIEAMKDIDSGVRILTTEPLVNITAPENATVDQLLHASSLHDDQFQVTDMLSGRICTELRGRPEYLDILGYNYYYNNQWVAVTHETLDWNSSSPDQRLVLLHRLLQEAAERYGRPIVLSETSHPREERPTWISMIGREIISSINAGIPLWGVCWYPLIDRPDWDHLHNWHQSGLWDGPFTEGQPGRVLHAPSAKAFWQVQEMVASWLESNGRVKNF